MTGRRTEPGATGASRFGCFVCLLMLLAMTGCGSEDDQTSGGDGDGAQAEYRLCSEPAGSWTDTSDEDQEWRTGQPSVNWVDEAGCAVRLDHVWHSFADDHCDWGQVERISFGLPLGTPYTGDDATPPGQDWEPAFVFNTGGAVDHLAPGEEIGAAEVPATARDTGLRTVTNRTLFLAEDDSVLYDVQGNTARVFVRVSDDDISCA